MKLRVFFLVTSFFLFVSSSWDITFVGKRGYFDRFDNKCKDRRKNKMQFNFANVSMEKNIFSCKFSVDVTQPIDEIGFAMKVERCQSKESPDTCEEFYSFKTKKFCNLIGKKNTKWGGLYNSVGGNFTCPLKEGHYVFDDVQFDLGGFPFFPVSGWFWKFYNELTDPEGTERYCCFTAETTVNFIKHH